MEFLDKTKENVKQAHREAISQSLGLITSAFVFVAGLAWNDAIKNLISRYLPTNSGLISHFVYAIFVTIIAVVITMRLNQISKKYKTQDDIK